MSGLHINNSVRFSVSVSGSFELILGSVYKSPIVFTFCQEDNNLDVYACVH